MNTSTPPHDDKKKALQILGPAVAVAAVVVLIGLMVSIGNSSGPSTAKGKPGDPPNPSGASMAGQFNFPLDNPEWKDIGDGLKIWDVKEGTGEPCPSGANVSMYYVGWLTNGTRFDGNFDKGSALQISLNQVVDGWKRGIPGMKAGGIRRLYIPSVLGYGPGGTRGIPGNSDLVFEVEMLGFQ